MRGILLIGFAGALGAMLRFVIGLGIQTPFATLVVNLSGSFLLCLLAAGVVHKISEDRVVQDALMTGFLGSFTTYSAFSFEIVQLFEAGQIGLGAFYAGTSIIGGLLVGYAGFHLGEKWVKA